MTDSQIAKSPVTGEGYWVEATRDWSTRWSEWIIFPGVIKELWQIMKLFFIMFPSSLWNLSVNSLWKILWYFTT